MRGDVCWGLCSVACGGVCGGMCGRWEMVFSSYAEMDNISMLKHNK